MPEPRELLIAAPKRFHASFRGELFPRHDFHIELVGIAGELLTRCRAVSPSAIVVHHDPPEIDAARICRELITAGVAAPVLAILGQQHASLLDALVEAGARDILFMPLDRARFLERVGEAAGLKFRGDQRCPLNVDVMVRLGTDVSQRRALDASASGMRLSGPPLAKGARVKLRFTLSGRAFEVWSMVAHNLPEGQNGMRLLGLSTEEEGAIRAALARVMRGDGVPETSSSVPSSPIDPEGPTLLRTAKPWPPRSDMTSAGAAFQAALTGSPQASAEAVAIVRTMTGLERRCASVAERERGAVEHAVVGALVARLLIDEAIAMAPRALELNQASFDELVQVGESAIAPLQTQLGQAVQAGDLARLQQINTVKTSLLRSLSDTRAAAQRLRESRPGAPKMATTPAVVEPVRPLSRALEESLPAVVEVDAPKRLAVVEAAPELERAARRLQMRKVLIGAITVTALGAGVASWLLWRDARVHVLEAARLQLPGVLHAELNRATALVYVDDAWGKNDLEKAAHQLAERLKQEHVQTALVLDERGRQRVSIEVPSDRVDVLPVPVSANAAPAGDVAIPPPVTDEEPAATDDSPE